MRYKTRKPSSCWGHQESGTQSGKQRDENRKDFKQIAKEGWMILKTLKADKYNKWGYLNTLEKLLARRHY